MKKFFYVLLLSLIISANSLAEEGGSKNGSVKDCFEGVNRGIFAFNQGLDKAVLKPLAKGYRKLPQPIRSGTSNALNNLGNLVTIPNNILQGQLMDASINSLRLVINSTLGIAGIFDVASYYGKTGGNITFTPDNLSSFTSNNLTSIVLSPHFTHLIELIYAS